MRKFICIAGFVLAFAVPLVSNLPNKANAQSSQQQEFTLKVNQEDINTIGKALGKLPFEEVANIVQKLRQQIVEQQKPPVETPPAPVGK